jgi:hypothetical protein
MAVARDEPNLGQWLGELYRTVGETVQPQGPLQCG